MSLESTDARCEVAPDLALAEKPRPLAVRVRRGLLAAAGWLATGLGLVGVFLPLIPTTPFLLLAGACFGRSSPRLHAWLLAHPRLGPYLHQWRRDRSVPPQAKRKAVLLVLASFIFSILLTPSGPVRVALTLVGLGVLTLVGRLRTR